MRKSVWPIVAVSVLLAALVALTLYAVTGLGYLDTHHPGGFIAVTIAAWLLFGLAVFLLRRVPLRAAVTLIVAGSVLIGGAALAAPPNTSDDSARYAWDGIVQNAGISPYEYVPVDDRLADLRPDWLFPAAIRNADGTHRCLDPRTHTTSGIPSKEVFCIAINRSKVPTIYPPTSELFFAAVRFVVGPEAEWWPLQLTGALMSVAITIMLLVAMRRRGMDLRLAALWAFCPLVASEAINNSHIDVLGGLLVLLATLLVSRGLRLRGGIALGAAIAVKLIPVFGAPALLRRQPWKVIIAAVLTFAVLYIPYVITTGIAVIGYLPGYLTEEGYGTGDRLTLLSILFPSPVAIPVAAVVLIVTAGLVWWRTNPEAPWLGQVIMIGTALLIASPRYPWYALLLVPFIALSGRWEWFAVPLAIITRQLIPSHVGYQIALGVAVLVIVGFALYRTGPGGRNRLRHPIRWLKSERSLKTVTVR